MKKRTKIILIVTGIIIVLIAIIGVSNVRKVKPMSEKEYMIKVAKAHKEEMDKEVRYGDKDHHIKSITYEWNTVKKNPMGGFMINGYVNGDKELFVRLMIDKVNGKIECRMYTCSNVIDKWEGQ
ncbi:DUF1310 family protein [Ligilactobacillus sp. LYQ135]